MIVDGCWSFTDDLICLIWFPEEFVKALWEFQAYHGISVPRLRHRVELQKVMARHDMDTGKSTKTPRAPVEAVELEQLRSQIFGPDRADRWKVLLPAACDVFCKIRVRFCKHKIYFIYFRSLDDQTVFPAGSMDPQAWLGAPQGFFVEKWLFLSDLSVFSVCFPLVFLHFLQVFQVFSIRLDVRKSLVDFGGFGLVLVWQRWGEGGPHGHGEAFEGDSGQQCDQRPRSGWLIPFGHSTYSTFSFLCSSPVGIWVWLKIVHPQNGWCNARKEQFSRWIGTGTLICEP